MTLKVISRESKLAKVQVEELKRLLPNENIDITFVSSVGDTDLKSSLMDSSIPGDFFTRELDRAVLEGDVDIAVHSAKDLPYPLPEGLEVIALTKAGDKSDSLVSRDGLTLETLPQGAKVGTSSLSRKEQLLAIRPDVTVVSIRGDIDRRISYIDQGTCDAVIVATCALHRLGYSDKIAQILPFETHPLQGNLAVVAKVGSYQLAQLFAAIDYRKEFGTVALVGAGPGDPELITRKGERFIREADVIFYDDLLDRELLSWHKGEQVFVGKRKGEHYRSQDEINELLYKAALDGKSVVRLKCGDPLLFSRGGEEIDYLCERFVAVEVVPGVSSFQGCAASLRMPLTKRGASRSLHAVSAHYEKPGEIPVSSSGTQIVFMGGTRSAMIQESLLQKGWGAETPILIVSRGTYKDERVQRISLAELHEQSPQTPAMIIIGEVAHSALLEAKTLFLGIDPSRVKLPGRVVHWPLIKLEESALHHGIDKGNFDGIIFTSKGAVDNFFKYYDLPSEVTVATIGPRTAETIASYGGRVDIMPDVHEAEYLLPLLKSAKVGHWLYPCSNLSKNLLHSEPSIEPIVFYETVDAQVKGIELSGFQALFFTSSSTVDAFFRLYREVPEEVQILVYGEPTAKRLVEKGVARERIAIWPIGA